MLAVTWIAHCVVHNPLLAGFKPRTTPTSPLRTGYDWSTVAHGRFDRCMQSRAVALSSVGRVEAAVPSGDHADVQVCCARLGNAERRPGLHQ